MKHINSNTDSSYENNEEKTISHAKEHSCAQNNQPDLRKLKKKSKPKNIPFWSKDPNILLDSKHGLEFFPVEGMSFTQKLNAITRLVIVLTVLSFLYSQSARILGIGALSILAIFLLHFAYTQNQNKEGLGAGRKTQDPNVPGLGPMRPMEVLQKLEGEENFHMSPEVFSQTFEETDPENPMGNVMLTDYLENPDKKPAPPSYTKHGKDNILENTKKMIADQNPGQPDISEKLFRDLGDEINFQDSLQPFYSTASTTIPNDQTAFANFCYGDMISGKEGNMVALTRQNPRVIDGNG